MKLAIMQPYFLPYIGYFQLLNAVDRFVVYDNIQFSKRGWINRNRILVNGADKIFSIPLRRDSDYLDANQRELASNFDRVSSKTLRVIEASYRNAPYFADVMPLIEECFRRESNNLFEFIYRSLVLITRRLEIDTEIVVSSSLDMDHTLKSQDRVLAICRCLKASTYINAIGGQGLYAVEDFRHNGVELRFLKSEPIEYKQFDHEHVPWLSIIDVMMFNTKESVNKYLRHYYSLL